MPAGTVPAGTVPAGIGRTKVRIVVGLLIVLALGTLWFLRAVLVNADGVHVPPAERMPPVPAGATASVVEQQCASGGCWLELRVRPPEGTSPAMLAEQMGGAQERCSRLNLIYLRSICTGSDTVDGRVVVYLRYESPVSF